MPEKRTLTTGDIAKYCGVNFRTVIRWIERGHLKAHQLPGRGDNRVEVNDYLGFLRTHEMPIPEEFLDRSRRILIVEDDAAMAAAMQRVLRRAGFETRAASDGFRAGTLLGTFLPGVMTLDLRMPGIPGLDVLKFVRLAERLKDIRILIVSAMPRKELDEALAAGADDVLEKPFRNPDLLDKVTRLAGIEPASLQQMRKGADES
jgi:excisionase family DNA binding protein